MIKWIKPLILKFEHYSDRAWYPVLIGFLAAIDSFIVIIPTDGILISSVLLQPKRWIRFATAVTVGSTIGALALAAVIKHQGLPLIQNYWPELMTTKSWIWTELLFDQYGLFVVFGVAATPLMQHPAIILSALAGESLLALTAVILLGRSFKYLFLGWVAAKAPQYLMKIWGLKAELKEVGVVDGQLSPELKSELLAPPTPGDSKK